MHASKVQIGMTFCFLTVTGFSHKDSRFRKVWDVLCACGNSKKILGSALVSGNTKSCGCYSIIEKKKRRISETHSDVTAIILGYKRHAADRGLKWNLSRVDVEGVIFKNCTYCGIEPSNRKKTKIQLMTGFFTLALTELTPLSDTRLAI